MSYTNNPRSIIAGNGITVTPTTGTGAQSVTISAGGTAFANVRIANATPVTVSAATDNIVAIAVTPAANVAVNLPAGVTGQEFTIKDALGLAAAATPITITPAAGNIDGTANAIINVGYGSLTMVYSGTQWLIL